MTTTPAHLTPRNLKRSAADRPSVVVLSSALVVLLAGCGGTSDQEEQSSPEPEATDAAENDDAGQEAEASDEAEEPEVEDPADGETEDDEEELAFCTPIPFANGMTVDGGDISNCWTEFALHAGSVKSRVTDEDGPSGEAHIMYGDPIQVYSFFEEEGMELIINGDSYSYISNGHPVPPGVRNGSVTTDR